ncbi:sodium:alanine symporter family protein [Veillonella sp. YH-vei2232]|jgi:AGCS family alanine or glycine:cation symporter|uniref:Sodium:alanine symporter family protein n=1 Tax=Veillonella absiana TaxID=3079305 RepID=A0ABU3Z9D4_9FIRM|nr:MULTISPECIES: sodium:alanine symporter family protein [unclassified Veillonella]NCB95256.1 sodium:alanine symporter family protein [Negativicutes bacterium]MBP6923075.1 sodium:alanine symporter family protein [Veillonella sp.]MBP9550550.1 sodium:alanine symporter family protein [Veillonella sp.]MDV5063079.1 sodium:alanine symporter family protein [Veillonella sp. YH-vei2232]MDV5088526.1 sodium:alanine symporter family protein [Veillonella sp. YH-vei2233]
MLELLTAIDDFIWGPPLLILLIGTGIMLTIRLKFLQVTKLPMALGLIFTARNKGSGDIDSFKALCTALAATVGTGNIVGVATAVHAGGPGAIFWMWVAAFVGMATKYAEGCLAVKYRTVDDNGEVSGGPMYYIQNGLGEKYKPLAFLFAFFGVLVAFFGIGTFAQVNAIVDITKLTTSIPVEYTAAILTVLVAAVTLGGLQSIAKTASKVVPAMAAIYVIATGVFLIMFADRIPGAIEQIIESAFTGTAAQGGFLGATVMLAMRSGVARGVFSNESGLGSAPIVAAAAKTKWPAEQGLISMTGTFIDTIIICTMTGLMLVVSGTWTGTVNGAALTNEAFLMAFPDYGGIILCVGLALFAFTTILGWNYYGERCVEYLVGVKGILPYRLIFIALVGCGAFIKLEVIWVLADIVNGLMAIPNLIALIGLSTVVVKETKEYYDYLQNRNRLLKVVQK